MQVSPGFVEPPQQGELAVDDPVKGRPVPPAAMKPRKLYPDEIQTILAQIPLIRSSNNVTAKSARQSLQDKILFQLQQIVITPLGIPDLTQEILRQFEKSLISPGETVGVLAADALGGPITQMALNTFHSAGSSKNVTSGIDAIKNLIYASPKPRSPSCTIVFKDRHLTFDDILNTNRGDIVGVMVSDVVTDYDVESRTALFDAGEPWWYNYYRTIVRDDIPPSVWILRLKIDVNMLHSHRIQPHEVGTAIEKNNQGRVYCVSSPIMQVKETRSIIRDDGLPEVVEIDVPLMYIDVYPHDRMLGEATAVNTAVITDENRGLIFITTILVPSLDKIQIKGVPGIHALFPVESPVWQAVKDETRLEPERTWLLTYNLRRMKVTGMSRENVRKLCQVTGMLVYDFTEDQVKAGQDQLYLIVQVPDKAEFPDFDDVMKIPPEKSRAEMKPGEFVQYKVAIDKTEEKEYEQRAKDERNEYFNRESPKFDPIKGQRMVTHRPPTEIYTASQFVYADTNGTNLKVLFGRDDIDPNHTVSNNMYEILALLGIEATRNFLIRGLIEVISYDNQYINPRHVMLLADFMTHQGMVTKITYSGIKKQPIGAFAQASFERAMDIISGAAAFGTEEPITSTSTSIFVGKRALIGTGTIDVKVDPAQRRKIDELMRQAEVGQEIRLDPGAFRAALDDRDDLAFGTTALAVDNERGELKALFGDVDEGGLPTGITNEILGGEPRDVTMTKPVVGDALKKVAEKITHAPCVPAEITTTFEVKPLFGGLGAAELPQDGQPAVEQAEEPISPTLELPTFETGIGLPNALNALIADAMTKELPAVTQQITPLETVGRVAPGQRPKTRPGITAVVTTTPHIQPVAQVNPVDLGVAVVGKETVTVTTPEPVLFPLPATATHLPGQPPLTRPVGTGFELPPLVPVAIGGEAAITREEEEVQTVDIDAFIGQT